MQAGNDTTGCIMLIESMTKSIVLIYFILGLILSNVYLSSCRAVCNCCLKVNEFNITASHSSCKDFSTAGMLVADGTLGFTIAGADTR